MMVMAMVKMMNMNALLSSMHCQKHRASELLKKPRRVGPKLEIGAEMSRNLKPPQASDGKTKTQRHRETPRQVGPTLETCSFDTLTNPKPMLADVGKTKLRSYPISQRQPGAALEKTITI